MDATIEASTGVPVRVERWPSEIPLFVLLVLAAIVVWILLLVSIVGAVYALLIGLFLFVSHVVFVAHLRGSAVRLGPDQFPELHRRVQELAMRAGIRRIPDAYLLQAGGVLNAVATKFLRSRFIVLYSDLLEACGSDEKARDMIIGHELGHIKAGHLNWMWLLAPGFLVPFLGPACSRAREYTCDRYGLALAGELRGALAGLAILAAGRERGPQVNTRALANQRSEMNTGWMTLGKWLGGHPPLCDRVLALDPTQPVELGGSLRGPLLAGIGVAVVIGLSIVIVGFGVSKNLSRFRAAVSRAAVRGGRPARPPRVPTPSGVVDPAKARVIIDRDLANLAEVAESFRKATGIYPADSEALYGFWRTARKGSPEPLDPFTNEYYFYEPSGDQFLLWSAGPDGINGTADDIHVFGGAKVPAP